MPSYNQAARAELQACSYCPGDTLDPSFRILVSRPPVKDAIAAIPRDYVKMHVLDNLARGPAGIAQDVIALAIDCRDHCAGHLAKPRSDLSEQLRGTVVQLCEVLLWNHQRVSVTYRTDVQKREHYLVIINPRNRYLPGHHFAKNAVLCVHNKIVAVIQASCSAARN